MKIIFHLIFLVFLVACGKEPSVYRVDAEFKPYVENFKQSRAAVTGKGSRITNFELKFKDQTYLGASVLGSCREEVRMDTSFFGKLGQKQYTVAVIEIDPEYWMVGQGTNIFADREQIINHEMGHCVLGQGHTNGVFVMNPYQLTTATYLNRYSSLINQLFKPNSIITTNIAYNQAAYVAASLASQYSSETQDENQEPEEYVIEESDFSDEDYEVVEIKDSDSNCILHK